MLHDLFLIILILFILALLCLIWLLSLHMTSELYFGSLDDKWSFAHIPGLDTFHTQTFQNNKSSILPKGILFVRAH